MAEIIINPELIYLGLALATAGGGAVGWVFKRGKKEGINESCAERIEAKLNSVEKTLKTEIANTDESHRKLHERIDKVADKVDAHAAALHEKINLVGNQLRYLEGQVDNHISEKKD